jgi:hypothetical protein
MVEIRGLEAEFAILIGHDNVPPPGRGKDAQPGFATNNLAPAKRLCRTRAVRLTDCRCDARSRVLRSNRLAWWQRTGASPVGMSSAHPKLFSTRVSAPVLTE